MHGVGTKFNVQPHSETREIGIGDVLGATWELLARYVQVPFLQGKAGRLLLKAGWGTECHGMCRGCCMVGLKGHAPLHGGVVAGNGGRQVQTTMRIHLTLRTDPRNMTDPEREALGLQGPISAATFQSAATVQRMPLLVSCRWQAGVCSLGWRWFFVSHKGRQAMCKGAGPGSV